MEKPGTTLNFGGRNKELWCEGGEEQFVKKMIEESAGFEKSVFWFISLISSKDSLPGCKQALEIAEAKDVRIIDMSQGKRQVACWPGPF